MYRIRLPLSYHVLRRATVLILAAGIAGLAAPVHAPAQSDASFDITSQHASRAELERTLDRLDEMAEAPGYSRAMRSRVRKEADMLRDRLHDGDFSPGDRVVVRIESTTRFADTLAVEGGRTITFPDIGSVSLAGVLRSELTDHLTEEVSRYIRNPRVQAHSLVRIAVMGDVGQPGYYVFPSDIPLSDVLMSAGGPSRGARLQDLYIERGSDRLWEGEALQTALGQGMTLDQLSLRAGDRVYVPERRQNRALQALQITGTVLTVVWGVTRVFSGRW